MLGMGSSKVCIVLTNAWCNASWQWVLGKHPTLHCCMHRSQGGQVSQHLCSCLVASSCIPSGRACQRNYAAAHDMHQHVVGISRLHRESLLRPAGARGSEAAEFRPAYRGHLCTTFLAL